MTIESKWKFIKDHGERYRIDNSGNVESCSIKGSNIKGNIWRPMSPYIDRGGYFNLRLWSHGKRYSYKIHRLVAEYFLNKPTGKDQVNHKDGCKKNNHYSNLEWCDHKDNMRHAKELKLLNGQRGMDSYAAKLNDTQVMAIRILLKHKYKMTVIAKQYGVNPETIRNIKTYRTWKHI